MTQSPLALSPHRTRLPQAWVVAHRPCKLPLALAAADALAERYPGGCSLVLEDSSWWQHARWESYRPRFTAVHSFERVEACRGLLDVARPYRQFVRRQRALAALPVDPDRDVLVCLGSATGLGNAISSAHRDVRRLLCLPGLVHDDLVRLPDRWRYRFTTAGWLQNRLIEPLAGLERTLHLKPRLNRGGDGVRLLRLHKAPEAVYDAVVVLGNTGRERAAGRGPRTFCARFPDLGELSTPAPAGDQRDASERPRVVFFGTPFLLVKNLTPGLYAEHLDRCLEYLRRSYPDRTWVYRPHPAETGEAERLHLAGFQVEKDGEVAELHFLKHFQRTEAVYSVSSTVSRVALNFGLDAYCLWRCFPFAEKQRRFFEQLMGTVPPEFDLRDLSAPPRAYAQHARDHRSDDLGPSFGEALRTALDRTADRFARSPVASCGDEDRGTGWLAHQ